jgi:hypothetical protein
MDKNLALAKELAERYPNRLSYRVTVALGYLRRQNPASALAHFKGPSTDRLEKDVAGYNSA